MTQMAAETLSSSSSEQTIELGRRLGSELPANTVICLRGDLGAGKTTFCKGLVEGATGQPHSVTSPTFVYLNVYEGALSVYHFDLYRLHDVDEFIGMGFDEYFDAGGICCVEWSERIDPVLPLPRIEINLSASDPESRRIIIKQLDE